MNKEDYFKRSRNEGLPNRCPILNYCQRRAYTIYFYSEYYKQGSFKILLNEGVVPHDFEEKKIEVQGEEPNWSKGDDFIVYNNMCPEVNLFDTNNALPFARGIASSDGDWDQFREDKFVNRETKHFTECGEFSKYFFETKDIKPRKSSSSNTKRRRIGISQKLRFEIFQRDEFTCQYCGRTKEDNIKLELDHKIPVSVGGKDDYENLITSCNDCNQGKSNKVI